MRRALLLLLASTACGKELNPQFCRAHPDDPRCAGPDSAVDALESMVPVAHLSVETELSLTSTADIALAAPGTVIDTSAGTITPAWPGAVVLPAVAQEAGGDVMVVQVGSLAVDVAASVIEVTGDKPLVLVATHTLVIGARINVSANGAVPGPGGYVGGDGPGVGSEGTRTGTGDGGGGGGSYSTLGGHGGAPQGGAPGALYGSSARLEGGSGGGLPSRPGACTIVAGAGGGALQLTALESLTLNARINAGGSGGAGGEACGADGSGGAGGGAGGMIVLESPLLLGTTGVLGALGGGGGEGADRTGSVTGAAGTEATTDVVGAGGTGLTDGGDGGAGASGTTAGQDGLDGASDGNGGGGGGGVGLIYYLTTGAQPTYTASPPAFSP